MGRLSSLWMFLLRSLSLSFSFVRSFGECLFLIFGGFFSRSLLLSVSGAKVGMEWNSFISSCYFFRFVLSRFHFHAVSEHWPTTSVCTTQLLMSGKDGGIIILLFM